MQDSTLNIISVRENPAYLERAIRYIQSKWATPASLMVYEDCISHALTTASPLPQWYLLELDGELIGCAGLIANDFISRHDLYPWICALFIEENRRGHAYGSLLLAAARADARRGGFPRVYLCTDHVGYYERYGFTFVGTGYHPWGEQSRIYQAST